MKMKARDIVLAGLAVGKDATYTPVQVQKLFFLLDQEIPKLIRGPHFDFKPYNYGPFDKKVYDVLQELASDGLVDLVPDFTWTSYQLTEEGREEGEAILEGLNERARTYIIKCSNFVRRLSFSQLVAAIYKAYPKMRENSVFSQ